MGKLIGEAAEREPSRVAPKPLGEQGGLSLGAKDLAEEEGPAEASEISKAARASLGNEGSELAVGTVLPSIMAQGSSGTELSLEIHSKADPPSRLEKGGLLSGRAEPNLQPDRDLDPEEDESQPVSRQCFRRRAGALRNSEACASKKGGGEPRCMHPGRGAWT